MPESPLLAGFRKTQVFVSKPNPLRFIGFYWVLGFIGFLDFLFE